MIVATKRASQPRLLHTLPSPLLEAFVTHGHSVVLTDDHAPVEQLLAPVFGDRLTQRTG